MLRAASTWCTLIIGSQVGSAPWWRGPEAFRSSSRCTRSAAGLPRGGPGLGRRLVVACVGGPSGEGRADPDQLTKLATDLGLTAQVRVEPPCPQPELADWYRAATLVVVPSRAETFGLV